MSIISDSMPYIYKVNEPPQAAGHPAAAVQKHRGVRPAVCENKGGTHMNTSDAIRSRRSIRKYKKGSVIPKEHIRLLLEAAMMAPSACNTRPWEFVVVESEEIQEKITAIHPHTQMLKTASLAIVVCGRPDLQESICPGFWPQDCGAAIQNLLLQARELGYGTCWCGCYPVMDRVKQLQALLSVSSMPLAVIAVGEADEEPAARGFYEEGKVTYL